MNRFSAHSLWRLASVALALWAASALAVGSEVLSPQERLAAIRKGLVQAALDGPTRVTATQWVDSKGALQESSAFRAGMEVRGVRVLSYEADAQGDPLAKLQWVNANPSRPPAQASGQPPCGTARLGKLQHVVAWTWAHQGTADADTAPLLASLQSSVMAQLEQGTGPGAVWRLVERPAQSSRSSYEQALLGSGLDTTPWRLELHAKLVPPPPVALVALPPGAMKNRSAGDAEATVPAEPQALAVQLRMVLTVRQQTTPALQWDITLPLQAADHSWGAAKISALTREHIAQKLSLGRKELEHHLGCLPVVADVVQAGGAQVRINIGSAAGLRVGDEWVLANDQSAVQRALEPGVVDQTVLAQVQFVGTHHAELRAIAGNNQNVQTHWTAWPASALP